MGVQREAATIASGGTGPIEIITPPPRPSLRDETSRRAASLVADTPTARPVLYIYRGDRLRLLSDAAFGLRPPVGDGTARPEWTLSRLAVSELGDDPLEGAALAALPGAADTVADLVAAGVSVVLGTGDSQVQLIEGVGREFGRAITVLAVGDFGPRTARRCATVREACALLAAAGTTVVFVGADEVVTDDFERLVAAARHHGTAAVVAGAPHPEARLVVVAAPDGRCSVFLRPTAESRRAVPATPPVLPAGVEVAILGPVEVRGSTETFGGHPLLTELVVYLAMHKEGVSSTAWETALWPERRMPPQTIANRLSEARRALGFAPDGRPRLRRADDRHLVADVSTDWDRFRLLAEDEDDPDCWRRALGLVRGRPFTDLHQGHWVALEGFAIEVEHAVVDCALRLGRTALRSADPDAAIDAAQLALRAVPWDERLHRLLMVAADAAGDRAGVEATIRHLALVMEIDGDPLSAVHPETARLYARLLGKEPVAAVL